MNKVPTVDGELSWPYAFISNPTEKVIEHDRSVHLELGHKLEDERAAAWL